MGEATKMGDIKRQIEDLQHSVRDLQQTILHHAELMEKMRGQVAAINLNNDARDEQQRSVIAYLRRPWWRKGELE